nr:PREDICTED: tripartite motif-containing protein 5-like [Rhinolophus sinicus]
MYKNYIRKEGASWKTQIQNEIQSFQNCIKRLKDILDIEEQKELQKLKKTEENVLRTLAESEEELVQQSKLVSDLMSALEHRLQGSAIGMVQDVNGIMERYVWNTSAVKRGLKPLESGGELE